MATPCDPAHPSNNFCLASAGNNVVLDGIYISPYTAYVDGAAVQTYVICDDFAHEVQIGESWAATSASVGSASSGMYGSLNSNGYKEVAWLTTQLLSGAPNPGAISYAIWSVFQPSAVNNWLAGYGDSATATAVASLLNQAAGHVSDNFSNVSIYTPVAGSQTCCGVPQEFVVVRTPEASALATLGLNLSCLGALVYVMRRKMFPQHQA